MTVTPGTPQATAAPKLEAEMAVRLNDPVHGQAERIRLRLHLQNLQAQLRAQAESGLPVATYAQLQAARQAVDAAPRLRAPGASPSPHCAAMRERGGRREATQGVFHFRRSAPGSPYTPRPHHRTAWPDSPR